MSTSKKDTLSYICTIGPKSNSLPILRGLVKAGASALRINLSHTPADTAIMLMKLVRKASKNTPLIIDTQGKETRIGTADGTATAFTAGSSVTVASEAPAALLVSRPEIIPFLKKGDRIFVDDNAVELEVLTIPRSKTQFTATIRRGGTLGVFKNIRLNRKFRPPTMLTERDRVVIEEGKKYGMTEISLSYVHDATDVAEARTFVGKKIRVSSKIETRAAISNLDGLLKISDAILIDRNDLGTEIGWEKIPLVQKFIVRKCIAAKIPVFVATHLLENMITKNKPTRGEVNDIVNTVLDGVSGLVLSSETAVGQDPVLILKTLRTIAQQGQFIMNQRRGAPIDSVIQHLEKLHYL